MDRTGGSWRRDARLETAFFAHEHNHPDHTPFLGYYSVTCIDCDYKAEIVDGRLVETGEKE